MVADRSLAYDQGKKLAGKARAGIPVYWIIDLRAGRVEVHTSPDPAAGQYGIHVDYRPGQAVPVIRQQLLAELTRLSQGQRSDLVAMGQHLALQQVQLHRFSRRQPPTISLSIST